MHFIQTLQLLMTYSYSASVLSPHQSFRATLSVHYRYHYCASQKILKKSYPFHYSYLSATQNYSYSASFLSLNQSFKFHRTPQPSIALLYFPLITFHRTHPNQPIIFLLILYPQKSSYSLLIFLYCSCYDTR